LFHAVSKGVSIDSIGSKRCKYFMLHKKEPVTKPTLKIHK